MPISLNLRRRACGCLSFEYLDEELDYKTRFAFWHDAMERISMVAGGFFNDSSKNEKQNIML